jgi:hypothetical protein
MKIKQLKGFLIQKEHLLRDPKFNVGLLVVAVFIYIISTDIANYHSTVKEAWWRWKNILMADFLLVVFALRIEVKRLIGNSGFKIIFYGLLNYFFDQYYGLKGWSWNDYLTIIMISLEAIFCFFLQKKGYFNFIKKSS